VTDFAQILKDLNAAGVRYVVVGGIALISHGVVRSTRDLDAVYDPDPANLDAIRKLVKAWGATRPDGSALAEDALSTGRSIHLSMTSGELDLLSEQVASVKFVNLLDRSEVRRIDGVEAPICSLADLVALKRAAGRVRDLADLSDLKATHGELPASPED
jgi:predicted nucleotidyltransferase